MLADLETVIYISLRSWRMDWI